MANEREEGLAALQNGDFGTAQTKLEAAIAQDPADAQAHLYLGGVYHQQQRNEDAVRILTRATELLPMSAQAQYNLGIALEALGSHQEALNVYRRATALQDNYPLAQQGVERMQKAMQSAPTGMYGATSAPTGVYGTPSAAPSYEATASAPAYAPPPTPGYGAMPASQPYAQDQTQPVQPYPAQPYAAPAQPGYAPADAQAGYAQPAAYGQPPQQYDLAGNPIAAPQAPYGQPVAPGGYAPPPGPAGYQGQQWSPYPAQGQMAIEDTFSLGEAFKGWFQLLFTPRAFFAARQGASGFLAPLAMFTAYMLAVGAVYMVLGTMLVGVAGGIGAVIGITFGAVIGLVFTFIIGGIIHLVSRLFGGSGEYSGTVGAYIYSLAPTYAMLLVMLVIGMGFMGTIRAAMMGNRLSSAAPQGVMVRAQYNPSPYSQPGMGGTPYGSPGSPTYTPGRSPYAGSYSAANNPFAALGMGVLLFMLVIWFGWIAWMGILLGMGLCATQNMSTGSAVGTVIVSFIVMVVLGVILNIAMAAMFAGMVASVMPH